MIKSEQIKIKLNIPVTNSQIENFFQTNGIDVVRWAIVDVNGDEFTLNISYNTDSSLT